MGRGPSKELELIGRNISEKSLFKSLVDARDIVHKWKIQIKKKNPSREQQADYLNSIESEMENAIRQAKRLNDMQAEEDFIDLSATVKDLLRRNSTDGVNPTPLLTVDRLNDILDDLVEKYEYYGKSLKEERGEEREKMTGVFVILLFMVGMISAMYLVRPQFTGSIVKSNQLVPMLSGFVTLVVICALLIKFR